MSGGAAGRSRHSNGPAALSSLDSALGSSFSVLGGVMLSPMESSSPSRSWKGDSGGAFSANAGAAGGGAEAFPGSAYFAPTDGVSLVQKSPPPRALSANANSFCRFHNGSTGARVEELDFRHPGGRQTIPCRADSSKCRSKSMGCRSKFDSNSGS